MRLHPAPTRSDEMAPSSQAAFTMVEIALCLGIIGFALVAIIGVMPTGLKVQKENREETIISQDGQYLLEALRGGSPQLEDLTNFVDSVTVSNLGNGTFASYQVAQLPIQGLQRSAMILGLLRHPKYETRNGQIVTFSVSAEVRSISGSSINRDPGNKDFALKYLVSSEIIPFTPLPPETLAFEQAGLDATTRSMRYGNFLASTNLSANFHEIRLTLRWPVITAGNRTTVGPNSRTFRTLTPGRAFALAQSFQNQTLYYFEPTLFAQVRSLPRLP